MNREWLRTAVKRYEAILEVAAFQDDLDGNADPEWDEICQTVLAAAKAHLATLDNE